jgi:hypothetical protein
MDGMNSDNQNGDSDNNKPPQIPTLTIGNRQWGRKVGKHAQDWGLSPSNPTDRAWVRKRVEDIARNYDEVRQGPWHPGASGGDDYIFYRQGADVVIAKASGEFVTVLHRGFTNSWFQGASVLITR